jgi:hypothetical protein
MSVDPDSRLAGIIRISAQLVPASTGLEATQADGTLAELFASWGESERSLGARSRIFEKRLTGTLAGPRQHKLRANLTQIKDELERELAGLERKTELD